jgi:heavy metal sensor kinase
MFSSRAIKLRKSLAFRLTLWYTGVFTLSACIGFLLFYFLVSWMIHSRTDAELLMQAREFSAVFSAGGTNSIRDFALFESQAAGEKRVFYRLLNPGGDVFSSSNMVYWPDLRVQPAEMKERLSGKRYIFETVTLRKGKERFRVLNAVIGPGVILQIGQSLEEDVRLLGRFRNIFIGTIAFLTLSSAGVGWLMARRAVSGVEAIARTARKISGGALNERVPVKMKGDEIDQLAVTFNQMLDRIQGLLGEIKEMSDNIAHDLKSPLARIRGLAEVTLTTGETIGEFRAMSASTIEECDRLLDLINTMLMISKAEGGLDRYSRESFDLTNLVRDACELFGPMAEDKGIALTCEVAERCRLIGDVRMIQRMLSNLLDNAILYTPPGGKINVSLSGENGETIGIAVSDTGIGISSDDLPRIFDRFYRCDQSRSQPGVGLGLSLARAVARAHGGEITVTSRPGEGSSFSVTLPIPRMG